MVLIFIRIDGITHWNILFHCEGLWNHYPNHIITVKATDDSCLNENLYHTFLMSDVGINFLYYYYSTWQKPTVGLPVPGQVKVSSCILSMLLDFYSFFFFFPTRDIQVYALKRELKSWFYKMPNWIR